MYANALRVRAGRTRLVLNNAVRFYQSESGVYGYKPKPELHHEVPKEHLKSRNENSNFYRLVNAYREHAHKQAKIDPIAVTEPRSVLELLPEKYNLSLSDEVTFEGILSAPQRAGTVDEAVSFLNEIYSGHLGFEFSYLETEAEREWFAKAVEEYATEQLDNKMRVDIAKELLKSQAFDNFLATKFVSFKRYGGEGAESMMAFFYRLFELSAGEKLEKMVLGMPHRGRLNLLTGMLNFPAEIVFRKIRGLSEFPGDLKSTGDVASHLVSSTDLRVRDRKLRVTMLRNPSHLEAVNAVSMGKTRAAMRDLKDGAYSEDSDRQWSDKVINVQVHGDAAYMGQGINQECLAFSGAPHFEIGGSIHLAVNNQVGFTTPASRGRSSRYCTDVAKCVAAPVIHVNGDKPEMVTRAAKIAFEYQRKFRKDVFVDMNCFRRWGHNELDDPTMTNPLIYKLIHSRNSVPNAYLEELARENLLSEEEGKLFAEKYSTKLNEAFKRTESYIPKASYFLEKWSNIKQAGANVTSWNSGVNVDLLRFVGRKSVDVSKNLNIHPAISKSHVNARLRKIANDENVDWSTAEAMAIGSLLYEGYNVRLSGQDVGRGTFSHRHAMLVDQSTGEIQIPLNSMVDGQSGKLEVANSILSEEAVLGFEYGMSIESPDTLPIWEAQFGDFFNGAQIIIDTFVTSGETKWLLSSGLTMLLPHGYDGAGPEHSSCRIERFLQLTDSSETKPDADNVNYQVANPTLPSQYFHLLRRQMIRNFRKPLVIIAPKILLRHPKATSALTDMGPNTGFKNVLGDNTVDPSNVTRVILVSGKHYYALEDYRKSSGFNDTAILRVESLCPFPVHEISEEIKKYNRAKVFIWSQEEPRNMGAWSFVKPRFENMIGQRLTYCGRDEMAAPAEGEGKLHQVAAQRVIEMPFTIK